MIILGIETSCDETAVAILKAESGGITILANAVNSQVTIHTKYGGVVPEVAARQHILNIIPLLNNTLEQADLEMTDIDLIAVTQGPGLVGAVMVGLETAKTLAWTNNIPFVPVSHLLGHLWSFILKPVDDIAIFKEEFPYLSLIVSGGHTELALIKGFNNYKILGKTLDDAVGEAFDKVAKILELGYPGGPAMSKAALTGDKHRFKLPRPLINKDNLDFSFAGLKTAVLYSLRDAGKLDQQGIADMAASFQAAAVDVLCAKIKKAISKYPVKMISVTGGVSANNVLREQLRAEYKKSNISIIFPELDFTGDNAAMIALAGYFVWQNTTVKQKDNFMNKNSYLFLSAKPNLNL